jgi:hypothetical protein
VTVTHAVAASRDASGDQPGEGGSQPTPPLHLWPQPDGFHVGTIDEANDLLSRRHYLGPIDWGRLVICQWRDGQVVGAMVWRTPTSRRLPPAWLELARWCLTPEGGDNAGSRMHRAAVRELRARFPDLTTLVSYSDPSVGHTGALYRACNWRWRPTWMQLKPPPSGGGSWDGVTRQEPKARWIFELRPDADRESFLYLEPSYAAIADAVTTSLTVKRGSDHASAMHSEREMWRARRDSNSRPLGPQPSRRSNEVGD